MSKKIYFTVGPSQIYPTVPSHLKKALEEDILSLNHRGAEFKKLYQDVSQGLKKLLKIPADYQIFFVSSALEAMERTIQGTVENTSFHIITGSFGSSWAKYAKELGKNVIEHNLTDSVLSSAPVTLSEVKGIKEAELICITQNDTSTGIWIPMEEIYSLKKKNPGKLIAIDVVSSIPYVDIDFKKIDITFFSVQKGFGLPAGLGVIIVSPKALEKTDKLEKKGSMIGSYHSYKNLWQKAKDFQTPQTPNVLNIYLLDKVLKDIQARGLGKIRKEISEKSKLLYDFFSNHKTYSPYIKDPKFRSPTTAVFDVNGQSKALREKLSKKNFIIGAGYGSQKENQIRIANFPSHNLADLKKLLDNI